MPNNMPSQHEFPIVRRGFDPDSVDRYIAALQRDLQERVAASEAKYSNLESALAEAHKREEAVHLTLVAATKTKEEMLVKARREAEQTMARSREQAEALLGEAKKEAFRLMTDARQTAQEATTAARADAEETRAAAQTAAESIRDKARLEAIEMINSVETDTTSLLAAREAALAEMREKYDQEEAALIARIDGLRTAASDLETRLKAIAAGSLGAATHLVADLPIQAAAPVADTSVAPDPQPMRDPQPVGNEQPTPIPQRVPVPEPARMPRPAAKARPPIPSEMTEAYLAAAGMEQVAAGSPSTNGAAPSKNGNKPASVVPSEEIEAQEIAAQEIAAAELRAAAMAEAKQRAAVEMPPEPLNMNGHTYVEPIEDLDLEESAEEETTTPPDDSGVASGEPEVDAETAATKELETEEETERVPVTVGATAPRVPFEDERGRKGSYYSRRSAKLPRIGNEAGRSALAAANAIRGASRGMPVDED